MYCNSLLATLNVRESIRGRAQNDLSMSLRPMGDTSIGTKDNRRVCARTARSLLQFTQPSYQEIHIKTETVQFTTGEKSDGSSIFAQPTTGSPRAVEDDYELESGKGVHLE